MDQLEKILTTLPTWQQFPKSFSIGIAQGITEPEAIRRLAAFPNSEVRLFIPTAAFSAKSLTAPPLFHPKVIAFDSTDSFSLLISSANLTASAYGDPIRNYELGSLAQLTGNDAPAARRSFEDWWGTAWLRSKPQTDALLDRYASYRDALFVKNPDILEMADPPFEIETARHFWMEAGMASGMDRHQIEFPEWLARFFREPVRGRVDLRIRIGNRVWDGRPLTHKVTTLGVEIWRFGTPTIRAGGEWIQNRVLRFTRTNDPDTFDLAVEDVGSASANRWRKAASKSGQLGQTGGASPRQYGVY